MRDFTPTKTRLECLKKTKKKKTRNNHEHEKGGVNPKRHTQNFDQKEKRRGEGGWMEKRSLQSEESLLSHFFLVEHVFRGCLNLNTKLIEFSQDPKKLYFLYFN